jgi:hypothetical protein
MGYGGVKPTPTNKEKLHFLPLFRWKYSKYTILITQYILYIFKKNLRSCAEFYVQLVRLTTVIFIHRKSDTSIIESGSQSIEWLMEDQAFSQSMILYLAPPPPPPPISLASCLSFSVFLCVAAVQLTEYRRLTEGGGGGRRRNFFVRSSGSNNKNDYFLFLNVYIYRYLKGRYFRVILI